MEKRFVFHLYSQKEYEIDKILSIYKGSKYKVVKPNFLTHILQFFAGSDIFVYRVELL